MFKHKIFCVIHFAGLKAVGESVQFPLLYYEKNLVAAINVLQCMKEHNCKNLIFSSSCTVYGSPHKLPITEETPVGKCTCAYGRTKYFIEQIVQDHCAANQVSSIAGLRIIKHLILIQTLPDFRCWKMSFLLAEKLWTIWTRFLLTPVGQQQFLSFFHEGLCVISLKKLIQRFVWRTRYE